MTRVCRHSRLRCPVVQERSNDTGTTMSADKDRGIRRQKQKRAKELKKLARQPPKPASIERGATR